MAEFIEIIKNDAGIQNEISLTIEIYNNESLSAGTQKGQNALIQKKVFKQAIKYMGGTISDMDI